MCKKAFLKAVQVVLILAIILAMMSALSFAIPAVFAEDVSGGSGNETEMIEPSAEDDGEPEKDLEEQPEEKLALFDIGMDFPVMYSANDVAVINQIIADTGLGYTQDAPEEWDFATWNEDDEARVTALNLNGLGLTGTLSTNGLDALTLINCTNNDLEQIDTTGCLELMTVNCGNNIGMWKFTNPVGRYVYIESNGPTANNDSFNYIAYITKVITNNKSTHTIDISCHIEAKPGYFLTRVSRSYKVGGSSSFIFKNVYDLNVSVGEYPYYNDRH